MRTPMARRASVLVGLTYAMFMVRCSARTSAGARCSFSAVWARQARMRRRSSSWLSACDSLPISRQYLSFRMYQRVGPSPSSSSLRGMVLGLIPALSISLAVAAAFCRCSSSCLRIAGGTGNSNSFAPRRASLPFSVIKNVSKELPKLRPVFWSWTRRRSARPALQSITISSRVKASCRIRRGRSSRSARIRGSAALTGPARVPPALGFQVPAQMGSSCVRGCGKLSVAKRASSTGDAACRKSRCVSPPSGAPAQTSQVPQRLPKDGASPKYSSSHLRRQVPSPAYLRSAAVEAVICALAWSVRPLV
mmetsp:Transcript_71062/g.208568  ORF Transcript_71062/g.208568 Transcript_71062/m.208568 type:complete len:307 (+) Transcript_71062:706-1626(+)